MSPDAPVLAAPVAAVCDLVLLSWNHWEQTRACLESLFEHTATPCRLFIVDNGSEPPVRAALAAVRPRGAILEVRLLQHETNEGFPRGMNRGIRASSAPFVCLLNNDLRFTPGWLEELLAIARAHPDIGLVNPASNTFGHRPPSGQTMQEYVERLRRRRGDYSEVGMGIGFCLLITREVLNRVGLLSEDVERIFFEDEDFSMRAVEAGYRCVVAEGAYVHHAEHHTVRRMPEREALFARNRRWCEQRWGRRVRVVWPRFDAPRPGSAQLRGWLEKLLGLARRRTHVYVFSPLPRGLSVEALYRSVGLSPHSDVHWRGIAAVASRWLVAVLVLKRMKKRYDILIAPDRRWGRRMAALRWWHGADVVPEPDQQQLAARCQERSRSRS